MALKMASTDTVSKALKRAKPRRSPFARTQRGEPFQADDTIAQTEPMDTARLAEEIERIMRRRERQTERVPQRPHRAWLGEREDIALVERSERMATARTVGAARRDRGALGGGA